MENLAVPKNSCPALIVFFCIAVLMTIMATLPVAANPMVDQLELTIAQDQATLKADLKAMEQDKVSIDTELKQRVAEAVRADKIKLENDLRSLKSAESVAPSAKPGNLDWNKVGEKDVPVLLGMLKDQDAEVRSKAAEALQQIKPLTKEILSPLLDLLKDSDGNVRCCAAGVLGNIDPSDKDAMPALFQLLSDPDQQVRHCASEALAKIDSSNPVVVISLIHLQKDVELMGYKIPNDGISVGEAEKYYNRGFYLWQINDIKGAVSCFNKAIELDPQYVAAYRLCGLTQMSLGILTGDPELYKAAVSNLKKAMVYDPQCANHTRCFCEIAKHKIGDQSAD